MHLDVWPGTVALEFAPHGYGMRWQPGVISLNVVSDALIFMAFMCIPFLLLKVIQKRKGIPFQWMFLAFGGFIFACGASHLMAIVTIWKPLYFEEGIIKLATALASLATAICLRRLLPALVKMPSPDDLRQSNEALALSNEELESSQAQLAASFAALQLSNESCRHSEAQFRQLADSMPQIVWTAKPNGFVDYYNEQWYSFTGFDRELFGDASWMPLMHPDDIRKRYKAWYSSVRSGRPFKEEYRFFDKETATFRWHRDRALPIKDEAGTVVKWFGASIDVDDYKRAEDAVLTMNSQLEERVVNRTRDLTRANEELRHTESWLRAILHSATDVSIIALDNQGIITFFNSGTERLVGYRAQDLVGKCTPYILYPAEQCKLRAQQLSVELKRTVSVDEIFLAINQPSESFVSEAVYLHRDGTPVEISLAISPIVDSSGERLGKLAIAVDVGPRKALERQLTQNNLQLQLQTQKAEEASRAKTNFLSAVSHEIRTPMNAILGMADLLWESGLPDAQRRYVDVFRRACTNLLCLVNDILDLSKIESGRFDLEQIDFDLRDLLEMTLEMVRPRVLAKQLRLESAIAADTPPAIVGDPVRLQQILSNLLSNAVKFTQTGTISLTVKPSSLNPNRLYFQVSDTGIGIAADKLDSIFEDFTQAESSITRRFGGTGLGLGICKRLVGRMGGELIVHSRLGEGSSFSFEALFAPGSGKDHSRTGMTTSVAGRRVLIADENKINRLIFVEMCRDWGMEVAEFHNAADVLPALHAAASQTAFHLVLIDRLISQTDGLQLAAEIREAYPSLPILVITSDNLPGDQTKVLKLGGTEYAVKPVRRPELLRLVCKLLGTPESRGRGPALSPKTEPIAVTERIRILIADDSDDNCFLLQEYLKGGAYEVKFVENGALAVALAETQTFDLILMDVQMPVMDGLTAAAQIRERERLERRTRVPMLALTANAHVEDRELSLLAGCDGHVTKPISRQELLEEIEKYARPASQLA